MLLGIYTISTGLNPTLELGMHHTAGDIQSICIDTSSRNESVAQHLQESPSPQSPFASTLSSARTAVDASPRLNNGKLDETPDFGAQTQNVGAEDFHLSSACIDDKRPMKVVAIGAGFSGIIAGIRSDFIKYLIWKMGPILKCLIDSRSAFQI